MKIKEILIEFGSVTTSHGIPNIIRAKSLILKTIWFIFLLISMLLCCVMIFKSVKNYIDFEVVTKIHVITKLPPIEFPTISICNWSPFVTDIGKSYYENNLENLKRDYADFFWLHKYLNVLNFSIEYQKSLGLKLEELIYECYFNDFKCDYEQDFVWFYDIYYGNCFRFNSGKNSTGHSVDKKKIYRTGADTAFFLKVFTGNYSPEQYSGILIIIHNSSFYPTSSEGFIVPPGKRTNIGIKRLFIHKKEYPYSDCIFDVENYKSELVQGILSTGYKYRQEDCLELCYQNFLVDNAGCFTKPSIFQLNNSKPCISLDQMERFNRSIYQFNSFDTKNYCGAKCPLECDSVQYITSISQANIKFQNNSNEKDTNLSLNIFYDSLSYTKIEELIKTEFVDLIATIGGTLGLFLGMSVLSFVEILELIFLIIDFYMQKNKIESFIKGNQKFKNQN